MNYLQSLLDGSNMPFLSAFILGLMTAISPCPMATNITAIAYIGKNIENKRIVFRNGLIYTLGRAFSYTVLGLLLFMGASKFHISSFFQGNGEKFLGPMLILIGIFMLGIIPISFPGLGKLTDKFQNHHTKGNWLSAFLMGVVFALAFCPYSGTLYFVMLIPMSISNASGLFLPPVFAIATGLPVIVFAYLIAFTLSSVGRLYNKLKTFEKWFRKIVAMLFILVGLQLIYIFYIKSLFE
jgi:cytochrome c-type biogenesis protein